MSKIESVPSGAVSVQTGIESTALGGINLYNYGGCDNLTLGQLVNAVCVHAGVALEDQTVNKMNIITVNARRLKALSQLVEKALLGAQYSDTLDVEGYEGMTYREFLENELKLTIGGNGTLPANLDKYAERLQLFTALKEKLNADATASQRDMIDLQTYESRRDVVYNTATNVVKNLGMSKQMVAANLK